jgi:hypothetical protein
MVEIGVRTSSAISTSLTPQSINGSTRPLFRTPQIHSPSETLHVTSRPCVHLATRTGTSRFRNTGTSERLLGCNSGLRCTTPSIAQTSTLLTSFPGREQRSAQSATPSQPEILNLDSNSYGNGKRTSKMRGFMILYRNWRHCTDEGADLCLSSYRRCLRRQSG